MIARIDAWNDFFEESWKEFHWSVVCEHCLDCVWFDHCKVTVTLVNRPVYVWWCMKGWLMKSW